MVSDRGRIGDEAIERDEGGNRREQCQKKEKGGPGRGK